MSALAQRCDACNAEPYVMCGPDCIAIVSALNEIEDGTSGQDRESYSDTQDRDSYTASNPTCSCAHNNDGSVTTFLCPMHAEDDPCWTAARVTGRRRHGSVIRGTCSACGWSR